VSSVERLSKQVINQTETLSNFRDRCIHLNLHIQTNQKYFIAIVPGAELSVKITAFRKNYLTGLNPKDEHKKFPHITLQHTFSRGEEIEDKLHPFLLSLAERSHPFEIKLYGSGHFDRRVIFIGIEENPILVKLHDDLKEILLSEIDFDSKEVSVEYHPHITLEKKIKGADFNFYWEKIRDIKFEGVFQCDSFSLMRHNGRIWEEAERFDLKVS